MKITRNILYGFVALFAATIEMHSQSLLTGHIADSIIGIAFDVPENCYAYNPFEVWQFSHADHKDCELVMTRTDSSFVSGLDTLLGKDLSQVCDGETDYVEKIDSTHWLVRYHTTEGTFISYYWVMARAMNSADVVCVQFSCYLPPELIPQLRLLSRVIVDSVSITGPQQRTFHGIGRP